MSVSQWQPYADGPKDAGQRHNCPEPGPMDSARACGRTSDGRHYRYSSAHNGYIFDGPETDPNVPPTVIIPGPHEDGCVYHYAQTGGTLPAPGWLDNLVKRADTVIATAVCLAAERAAARYYSRTHGGDWPEDH